MSDAKIPAPFGSWPSPLTPKAMTAGSCIVSSPQTDGQDLYWTEVRAEEKGRCVLVKQLIDGSHQDITPESLQPRTRAHEYGGRCYTVRDGIAWFSNLKDQQIYRLDCQNQNSGQQITNAKHCQFADHSLSNDSKWLIAVQEGTHPDYAEPKASIVAINTDSGDIHTLIEGSDFYAYPALNPNNTSISWIDWQHPNMPWDNTGLHVANIDLSGDTPIITNNKCLIPSSNNESCFQPKWLDQQNLCVVSDKNNWWNLYTINSDSGVRECIFEDNAEYGLPLWNFGMSTYDIKNKDTLLACFTKDGSWYLSEIDINNKKQALINVPLNYFSSICCDEHGNSYFTAAGSNSVASLYQLNDQSELLTIKASSQQNLPDSMISKAQFIACPTSEGDETYGFYYPPTHTNHCGPEGERPPLIVMAHGGPTASTENCFNQKVQFWTSRGFAVADINYRGSTGFGRDYRHKLNFGWGIKDVEDIIAVTNHLCEKGLADKNRLAIRGGSAGGYSVLCALTFHNVFAAGTSLYGIGDLMTLANDTHKFEARYLDNLVGPLPDEQQRYHDRSPIHFAEQLSCPCLFLQGLEDKVVPPNQAETMVDALKNQGTPVAYLPFEGEGHGFRQAATIEQALNAEYYFYSKIFGFAASDETAANAVTIKNL